MNLLVALTFSLPLESMLNMTNNSGLVIAYILLWYTLIVVIMMNLVIGNF